MRNLCLLSFILILFLGAKEPKYTTVYTASIDPMIDTLVIIPPAPVFTGTGRITDYLKDYYKAARTISKESHIPHEIILALSALESNWGRSTLSKKYNNFFGRKSRSSIYCSLNTLEYRNGELRKEVGKFKVYSSPEDSFKDFVLLLQTNKRYESLFNLDVKNLEGWAKGLQKAGYATDPLYASKLLKVINLFESRIKLY